MVFHDREDAARGLLERLDKYSGAKDTVILAIPRGGVEIGAIFAKELKLPMDVIFTKKVGHPENPEFAIGAVSQNELTIDPAYAHLDLEQEVKEIRQLLLKREERFRKGRAPIDLKGKSVIVTDDGVATGRTLLLTLKLIKKQGAKKIIVAIPIASPEAAHLIDCESNELICLSEPKDFFAISQYYESFPQVDEVRAIELYEEASQWR